MEALHRVATILILITEQLIHLLMQLMFEGKTKPALDLLSGVHRGKHLVLINELVDADESLTVRKVLKSKHPPAAPLHNDCLITDTDPALIYHPVIFDALDGSVICAAALRTSGAAGPSGVDAYGWRRLCTAFRSASDELCNCVAILTRHLCASFIDPLIISTLIWPADLLLWTRILVLDHLALVKLLGASLLRLLYLLLAVISVSCWGSSPLCWADIWCGGSYTFDDCVCR